MSKIRINELKAGNSELTELNDLEAIAIIGGHDEESESPKETIAKAMHQAVERSDILRNGNATNFVKSSRISNHTL